MMFEAEVISVQIKKSSTQVDKVIRLVLETNQEQALKLQEYIAKDTVMIEIKE